ncbi:hypothetical protein [Sphingomonas sp. PR090111-T3T-6A]|uniref:hypothetical protein n=1 Tax=Sphingomonas sp. PR090111-T3T-6A TaxID=685778 RepID=UPI000381C2D4|nr:hypothetical protein [Sphingomonas sp. PR090111-T3T-6A]
MADHGSESPLLDRNGAQALQMAPRAARLDMHAVFPAARAAKPSARALITYLAETFDS